MPETDELVINTGPLIAIVAGLGDLSVLKIYRRVLVPLEVCSEITSGGGKQFASNEFHEATWLEKLCSAQKIAPMLLHSLDRGEAAVIQLALDEEVKTVCIDESAGRRVARLNGLSVTGSIGILLRAKRQGESFSIRRAIDRMRDKGIWLSDRVVQFAIAQSGEDTG